MLSDQLTDRPVFLVDKDSPLWKRVTLSSVNWLDANKLGMTFGLLLAAICLSLLNLIRLPKFNNPFLNNICGAITGAPLGICVNCAAPVAKGLFKGGVSGNFALALMFSSPRSEEHTSELQSRRNLVCRLLLEKKKTIKHHQQII